MSYIDDGLTRGKLIDVEFSKYLDRPEVVQLVDDNPRRPLLLPFLFLFIVFLYIIYRYLFVLVSYRKVLSGDDIREFNAFFNADDEEGEVDSLPYEGFLTFLHKHCKDPDSYPFLI